MPASMSAAKSPFWHQYQPTFSIFIILRPRPRTYASTSPLLLLQLHQQRQLLSIINIINSINHHLQHAKLRILLQHLTSHAAYERSGGPPKRPAAKRPCIVLLLFTWYNVAARIVALRPQSLYLFINRMNQRGHWVCRMSTGRKNG